MTCVGFFTEGGKSGREARANMGKRSGRPSGFEDLSAHMLMKGREERRAKTQDVSVVHTRGTSSCLVWRDRSERRMEGETLGEDS